LELVNRVLPLTLEDQKDAEIVVNVVIIWLERDSFFEVGASVWVVFIDAFDNAVEVENLGVVGTLGKQLGAEWASFVNVVAHDESAKELEFGVQIAGVVDKRLIEELDGVFKAMLAG
jgi:hypothetical protein